MEKNARSNIRVPVFPGPAAGSPAGERPPTAPRSTSESAYAIAAAAAAAASSTDSSVNGVSVAASPSTAPAQGVTHWKLRHIDFAPNLVKGKKDDEFERFPVLVDRANQWSAQNTQALIFSCETVTWSGMDRQFFTDSGLLQKSMHSDKKSKFVRGLRVWYVVYDETFYDRTNPPGPFKLGFINYTLEGKNDNFQGLLAKINGDMFKKTVAGKILKVETLYMMSDVTDADVCGWSEQPEKARDFVSFMRMFYVFKKDGQEDTKYGDIGIRDFIPKFDQRTPLNQGYEVYADLWRTAARWLFTNPGLHFINAQGVFVKVKKEGSDAKDAASNSSNLWDRPNHREHGSAYGSMSHQRTDYIQILRVVYHQPPSAVATKPSITASPAGSKLFYKTFTPGQLRRVPVPRVTGSGSGQSDDVDSGPVECTYEDLRMLEDKINAWLSYTGAKVHGVETVPARLVTGGQEMLGPEATFVYNDREKNQGREYWRVNIRLYLDGEFKELPMVTRTSLDEVAQRCVGGSLTSLN